jgi:hypothetical protein
MDSCLKNDVPKNTVEFNSEVKESYIVDLSATWRQSFALDRSYRYPDFDLHKKIIFG